jgi:hypothetical protein
VKFWERRTAGSIKAIHPSTGRVIEVDPQRDAKIGHDLDVELRRLPALLSWYLALRDRAETRLREARHSEHNTEEDLYTEIRDRNPKVTETAVKMAVRKDGRMRRAFRERMDAEDMHQKLRSAVEAIAEKRWSLMSLVKTAAFERGTKDGL